jgi:hypothetical protein
LRCDPDHLPTPETKAWMRGSSPRKTTFVARRSLRLLQAPGSPSAL